MSDATLDTSDSPAPLDPIEIHRQNWPETFDLRAMSLLLALHRVHAAESAAISWVIARHGLSVAEFDVLTTLRRSPPPREMTPTELQGQMIITSGGLTKILRQLETRGLIKRSTTVTDRRIKPAHLTARGAKIIEQAMGDLMDATRDWTRPVLSHKEIEQLTGLLLKLSGAPGV